MDFCLHQAQYTEQLVRTLKSVNASFIPARSRTTAVEAKAFQDEKSRKKTDKQNPEHLEWIKIGQKIIGVLF